MSSSSRLPSSPPCPLKPGFPGDREVQEMQLDVAEQPSTVIPDPNLDFSPPSKEEIFGDWMVVHRRRGRGRGSGRFSTEQPRSVRSSSSNSTWRRPLNQDRHVDQHSAFSASRGRGGRGAQSSRASLENWLPPRFDLEVFPILPSQSNGSLSHSIVGANPSLLPNKDLPLSDRTVASGSGVIASLKDGSNNDSLFAFAHSKGKAVVIQDSLPQESVAFSQPILQPSFIPPSNLLSNNSSSLSIPSPPSSPPPVLMSSLSNPHLSPDILKTRETVDGLGSCSGGHAAFVEQVVKAFCPPLGVHAPSECGESVVGDERESMPGSESPEDLDEDMTLSKFQTDFRVFAKKEGRRSKLSKKKGRSSAPY